MPERKLAAVTVEPRAHLFDVRHPRGEVSSLASVHVQLSLGSCVSAEYSVERHCSESRETFRQFVHLERIGTHLHRPTESI